LTQRQFQRTLVGMDAPPVVAPSRPFRALRGQDAWGSGEFGASRDNGKRHHIGQDYVALPDDDAVWPVSGKLIHIAPAYANSDLRSIIIVGSGRFEGWMARLDYVLPEVPLSSRSLVGEHLGRVQDVAAYWAKQQPGREPMTNHVHFELWRALDPRVYLAVTETV